jgi:hypothetical protein
VNAHLATLALLVMLTACGAPDAPPEPSVDPPESTCQACSDTYQDETQKAPTTPLPPIRQVVARPSEVGFFGSIGAAAIVEPRTVTLTNSTSSTVKVTSVHIANIETLLGQTPGSDAAFFSVTQPSLDSPLLPGESLAVLVRFTGSSDLRTAVLVLETTHPAYTQVLVGLSGKVFISF